MAYKFILFFFFIIFSSISCVSTNSERTIREPNADQLQAEIVEINVNASYSASSLWTEEEIRTRFIKTAETFQLACPGLKLKLAEVVRNEKIDLQDIDGSLGPDSVSAISRALNYFQKPNRPTILYVRRGKWDYKTNNNEFTKDIGKAYTLDGPRPLKSYRRYPTNDFNKTAIPSLGWQVGNLNWERFQELRHIHGIIVIGEGNSAKSSNVDSGLSDGLSTDRHELSHVLLNDGSHREIPNNITASAGSRTELDQDQCEIILAFNQLEAQRDMAIRSGMQQICSLFESNKQIPGKPNYCP